MKEEGLEPFFWWCFGELPEEHQKEIRDYWHFWRVKPIIAVSRSPKYASVSDGNFCLHYFRFNPKILAYTNKTLNGIVMHELAHALDFALKPRKKSDLLKERLPESRIEIERDECRAWQICERWKVYRSEVFEMIEADEKSS